MPLTFEEPIWLLLLLLIVPVAITGLLWFTSMSRARAWSAVILRSILIALVACILAGASAVHTTNKLAVIAVVDVSESVTQFARFISTEPGAQRQPIPAPAALRRWLAEAAESSSQGTLARAGDNLFGVIAFDGASIALSLPRPLTPASGAAPGTGSALDFSLDYTFAEGTNIEQALRFAAALFPADAARRIVLISDGNQTEGDAVAAAREIATASTSSNAIPIDVLPLSYRVTDEVMIEAVDAPPQAAVGAPVTVRIVINATQEVEGSLELEYEGQRYDLNGEAPGAARRITLRPGRNIETVQVKLNPDNSVHRFRPVFTPDRPSLDRIAINNSAEAFTITQGKGKVLIIDGVGNAAPDSPGRILARTLERASIPTEVLSPTQLPTDLLTYQAYDLIIMQDVAAEEIPRSVHRFLADYVSDLGGGFVMVGGPDSFGSGGWKGTDLEPILPVNLDLPEQLLVPSAAVSLVIDNSGSMSSPVMGGMRSQQEIANEGAGLAIETLDKTDIINVIAFNSDYDIIVPTARNSNPQASAARVRNIGPGGGTNLYPALARAARELSTGEAAKAAVRHCIVLSDGRAQGDPEEGFATARAMRQQGITVSTISVGDGADTQTLARIAAEGGGQFYQVIDPNVLPRIFVKEIRIVRKPLIRETPFTPIDLRSGSPLISAIPRPFPPLQGLILTQQRQDPTVSNILATPEGEPVLAAWFVGRGQVAAFTSDAHNWAEDWINQPAYAALWTQIARSIARPAAERTSELITEIVGNDLLIKLDAADQQGKPLDLLSIPGTLYTPSGKRLDIRLSQVGPGTYETRVPAAERGNYFTVLLPQQGDRRLSSIVGGASRALGSEFRHLQSDIGILQQIAEVSGGRLLDLSNPQAADLFNRDIVLPVRAASPIWRILLIWAIAVFILDVATRRVAWDRLLSRELARDVREQAASAVRARGDRAAATLAGLRSKAAGRAAEPAANTPALEPLAPPTPAEAQAQAARLRAQVRSAIASAEDSSAKAPAPPPDTGTPAKPEESTTSGLLAAKRRARKQFEEGN